MMSRTAKRIGALLLRMDITSALLILVTVVLAVGSLFPQMPAGTIGDAAARQAWESAARARYGSAEPLLSALGLFNFPGSPLLIIPAGLLIIGTVVCGLARWRRVVAEAFDRTVSCPEDWFDAASVAVTVASGASPARMTDLSEELRRRHYSTRTRMIDDTLYLRADRNQFASLASLLHHLAVVLLLVGILLTANFASSEQVAIGPHETVQAQANGEWALRNDGFQLQYDDTGSLSSYVAHVAVVRGDSVLESEALTVNRPLSFDRHVIYLSSYWEADGGYGVVLIVARDPGFVPFLAAGLLMLLGMICALYLPHTLVRARVSTDGEGRIAIRRGRSSLPLGSEYRDMVDRLAESLAIGSPQSKEESHR